MGMRPRRSKAWKVTLGYDAGAVPAIPTECDFIFNEMTGTAMREHSHSTTPRRRASSAIFHSSAATPTIGTAAVPRGRARWYAPRTTLAQFSRCFLVFRSRCADGVRCSRKARGAGGRHGKCTSRFPFKRQKFFFLSFKSPNQMGTSSCIPDP